MNKLNPSQGKQLREIAAYLKQKRIEQSLSLEQISSRTFIRLYILQALEAAQVDQLPELIYIQGFIRRYGEVLHIDGNSLAKRLSQTDSAVAVETPPPPQTKSQPQPQPQPQPKIRTNEAEISTKQNFQRYWLLIAIIGCLGASVGALYALSRPDTLESLSQSKLTQKQTTTPPTPVDSTATKPVQPTPEKTTSPVAVNTSSKSTLTKPTSTTAKSSPSPVVSSPQSPVIKPTPATAKPSSSPVASPTSSPSTQTTAPLSVAVALDGTSWLKIKVDGKTEYEGILEQGVKQTWTAKEKLTIIAGNAGAVSYSVNQKPPQRLGEPGEVKEIKLTPPTNNTTP